MDAGGRWSAFDGGDEGAGGEICGYAWVRGLGDYAERLRGKETMSVERLIVRLALLGGGGREGGRERGRRIREAS